MAATRVVVDIPGERQYGVRIGEDILKDLGAKLAPVLEVQPPSRILVISDSNVAPLYLEACKQGLATLGCPVSDINLDAGKNLVGTFLQPSYVCASTDVLATLDEREWACGCAEIAKSALIDSDDFFFWLVENAPLLAERQPDVVREAIARSVVFKAGVVAQDKTESRGVRECLNYGHTLGHAIETLAGYGAYSHGAAVAEGMRFAARLGQTLAGTPLELVEAQDALLDQLGLPVLDWKAPAEDILDAMKRDKKARQGAVRFVLPADVGAWELVSVDDDTILEHLRLYFGE